VSNIYRQEALDRLAATDELDELIIVTRTSSWIGVSGIAWIIGAVILWAIYGTIETVSSGSGVLMPESGLRGLVAPSNGTIIDIEVSIDDTVAPGAILAHIEQTELRYELASLQEQRDNLEEKLRMQESYVKLESDRLSEQITLATEQIKAKTKLLQDGLVTRHSLEADRSLKSQLESQLASLPMSYQDLGSSLATTDIKIQSLIALLDQQSNLRSPYSGRIVAINRPEGSTIRAGEKIFDLEPSGSNIRGLIVNAFIPIGTGKLIKEGMELKFSPTTVKREEFGSLVASVYEVSEYPVTAEYMMARFQSRQVVDSLLAMGPAVEVKANLLPSDVSATGFQWTSSKGPETKLQTGTEGAARVTIKEQSPITLVIPALKKFSGLMD
jgi:HlyD family secretion protein